MRDSALLDEVECVILGLLPGGGPMVTLVAQQLGISVRTLQRRLSQLDRSYSAIVEDARFSRAQSLLRDPDCSVTEIARLLGYSDASHFSRAFRRWARQCPTAYRRVELERHPASAKTLSENWRP